VSSVTAVQGEAARRRLLRIDVALKALVVGLTAIGAFSGLARFEDKGFGWRLAFYPVAIMALPVAWRVLRRGQPLPVVADILITLPFLIDVVGNVLDLYSTISWWDDANHFLNWALLSAGAGLLVARLGLTPLVTGALIVGWGAVTALLWELAEYLAFIRTNEDELATAYTDTLGDMTLGTLGSVVAAVVIGLWLRRGATPRAAPGPA
jgi:ABC-type sulfate transport system permease component